MQNKYSGNVSDFQPVVEDASRVVISYGLTDLGDGKAEWFEVVFYKKQGKPSFNQAKEAILKDIDAQTDEAILCGMDWTILHGDDEGKTVKVWLSKENQDNFKAKHDAAIQYPKVVKFPMKYKIGEFEGSTPAYENFQNIEELAQFYLGGLAYIEQCYNAGWARKDSIDWAPYEEALNPSETPKKGRKK